MTPLALNTAARQRYNAVGDTFWSNDEIYLLIYQAACELATDSFPIESSYTTSSVASQQSYDLPEYVIAVERVTYDGRKLMPITFREDDVLTQLRANSTDTGRPTSYVVFNNTLYLRPIPSSALTIKVYGKLEPAAVTDSSVLEIPSEFQMAMVNYILAEMSAKNKNYQGAQYYRNLWAADVERLKRFERRKLVQDAYQVVKNVDVTFQNDLGNI